MEQPPEIILHLLSTIGVLSTEFPVSRHERQVLARTQNRSVASCERTLPAQSYGADYLPASASHEMTKRLPETYRRGDPWASSRTPVMRIYAFCRRVKERTTSHKHTNYALVARTALSVRCDEKGVRLLGNTGSIYLRLAKIQASIVFSFSFIVFTLRGRS